MGKRGKGKELLPMPYAPCPIPHAQFPIINYPFLKGVNSGGGI
ncbi:hypothetical protein [Tolypothrix sp. VBCCA 56010]